MSHEFNSLSLVRLMKSSMFGLRLSQFGKIQSFDFLKLIFRSLGSIWFNRQLCLFRIECRVDGLLGLHCIKDSEECKQGWITNNQYWSNWNKIWIQLHYEDGETGETSWSKAENQQQTQPTYGVDAAGFEPLGGGGNPLWGLNEDVRPARVCFSGFLS